MKRFTVMAWMEYVGDDGFKREDYMSDHVNIRSATMVMHGLLRDGWDVAHIYDVKKMTNVTKGFRVFNPKTATAEIKVKRMRSADELP